MLIKKGDTLSHPYKIFLHAVLFPTAKLTCIFECFFFFLQTYLEHYKSFSTKNELKN